MASAGGCLSNCSRPGFFEHEWTAEELWAPWEVVSEYFEYQPWFFSLLGSAMVGLSGIFPLFVIPIDEAADLKNGDSAKTLKILLSFAVGGLLGDVFLHLLPEAWASYSAGNEGKSSNGKHASMDCGLWVLSGFLVFVIAEKMFSFASEEDDDCKDDDDIEDDESSASNGTPNEPDDQRPRQNNNNELVECPKAVKYEVSDGKTIARNGLSEDEREYGPKKVNGVNYQGCNGYGNGFAKTNGVKTPSNKYCELRDLSSAQDEQSYEKKLKNGRTRERPKHISGYLNLVANCVDNFTHGLAVGGSFLVSFRLGALTTFAILIHEIPHEIGDFAILLKSGFSRWDAAKAQLMTATGGMCGAFVAVVFSGDAVEAKMSWILPFTAGGFLHIGMVTVLPELLKETDLWESLKQIGALLTGIVVMAFLTIVCD